MPCIYTVGSYFVALTRNRPQQQVIFSYRLKPPHEAAVEALVAVGSHVRSGSTDGSITVWDTTVLAHTLASLTMGLLIFFLYVQTGHIIKQFKAHEGAVTALVTANDVFLSAGTDGAINVWSKVRTRAHARHKPHQLHYQTLTLIANLITELREDHIAKGTRAQRPDMPPVCRCVGGGQVDGRERGFERPHNDLEFEGLPHARSNQVINGASRTHPCMIAVTYCCSV
jgi:WD40 repeat protein